MNCACPQNNILVNYPQNADTKLLTSEVRLLNNNPMYSHNDEESDEHASTLFFLHQRY